MYSIVSHNFLLNFSFVCAGSSLVKGLFSSCREWRLLSSCGVWASHCGGLSCGAQALGLVDFSICISWAVEPKLISCGAWGLVDPWHVGSSQTRD